MSPKSKNRLLWVTLLTVCSVHVLAKDSETCPQGLMAKLTSKLGAQIANQAQSAQDLIAYQRNYWSQVQETGGRSLGETAKGAALWLPRQQLRYWGEVLEDCLKSPTPGSKCAKGVALRVVFPKFKTATKITEKLTPSAPVKLGVVIAGTTVAYSTLDEHIQKKIKASQSENPGGSYVAELMAAGLISTDFADDWITTRTATMKALSTLATQKDLLIKWQESGKPQDLPRLAALKKMGILPDERSIELLNELALKTYHTSQIEFQGFADRLENNWSKALQESPVFSKYSPEKTRLLEMLFFPDIQINKQPDIELIARAAGLTLRGLQFPQFRDPLSPLQSVAMELPNVSLLLLAKKALNEPKISKDKITQWNLKHTKTNETPPSFLQRPDLPEFSLVDPVGFDLAGKTTKLVHEIDYWDLVWSDPRFFDLKQGYQQGSLRELDVLNVAMGRVFAYKELYAFHAKQTRTTTKDLCGWMGATPGIKPNLLIGEPVATYLKKIDSMRELSSQQKQACGIDISEFFFNIYQTDLAVIQGKEKPKDMHQLQSQLNDLVLHCPQSIRVCGP